MGSELVNVSFVVGFGSICLQAYKDILKFIG